MILIPEYSKHNIDQRFLLWRIIFFIESENYETNRNLHRILLTKEGKSPFSIPSKLIKMIFCANILNDEHFDIFFSLKNFK